MAYLLFVNATTMWSNVWSNNTPSSAQFREITWGFPMKWYSTTTVHVEAELVPPLWWFPCTLYLCITYSIVQVPWHNVLGQQSVLIESCWSIDLPPQDKKPFYDSCCAGADIPTAAGMVTQFSSHACLLTRGDAISPVGKIPPGTLFYQFSLR